MPDVKYSPTTGLSVNNNGTTAYATMSAVVGSGNLNAPYIYGADDPFYKFAFATEPTSKTQAQMQLYQALNMTPDNHGFSNQYEYLKSLLAKSGLSKSPLTDATALTNVIIAGAAQNIDAFTFLESYNSTVKAKGPAVQDTTTRYTKQVQSALQFKDLGDARQYYSDAYFAAWGKNPSAELDKKFQDAWNNQVKVQDAPTTTDGKVEYSPVYNTKSKPVIDPKTKKQKIDKFGNKVYSGFEYDAKGAKVMTPKTTGKSVSTAEGFTTTEQQQFLADFLVKNNPNAEWNTEDLGGSAKLLYDQIVDFHKSNYTAVPDLATVAPLITNVLSSPDTKVQTEYITQYESTIRNQTAGKYMSIGDYVKAGENADKYIKPMLETLSTDLERDVSVNDPLALKVFNYKADDGTYRQPNAWELNNLIMADPSYGKTSKAINDSVNLMQNLKSKLGRG